MRRFLNGLKYLLLLLVLAVGLYFIAAVVLSLIKKQQPEEDCKATSELFVSSNGVHLDIIVPLKSLEKDFAKKLHVPRGTQYLAFGWGDKNFYLNTPQWKDLTLGTAFTAVFLKSESAMHVTSYRQKRAHWHKTALCQHQQEVLLQYIVNSFKHDENGELLPIGISGYGQNDRFYNARGSFSLFKTCNVWTNTGLKKAGLETSLWSPFAFGVLYHLERAEE